MKLIRKALLLFIILLISSCGSSGTNGSHGTTAVTLSLGASATQAQRGEAGAAFLPSSVNKVQIGISGPGMSTITDIVMVAAGQTSITRTYNVPNGSDRVFTISAYDIDGLLVYQGSQTVNLDGSSVSLPIPMAPALTGTISGLVISYPFNQPVPSPLIEIMAGQAVVSSFGGGVDGLFSVILPEGTYDIRITAANFITEYIYGVQVTGDQTVTVETLMLIDSANSGQSSGYGYIYDAITGNPIEGVALNFRRGIGNITGAIEATATTDLYGQYTVTTPTGGNYTAEAIMPGHQTSYFTVTVITGNESPQNGTIIPVLADGQTRIVLTWGATPSDLDSHLTGPSAAGRFHVFYGNQFYSDSLTPMANLDLDDTSSYGPETTTIFTQEAGVYSFYVHDYSNGWNSTSAVLSQSGAQVKVYRGSSEPIVFNVPLNQTGNVWHVFNLDGNTLTPVNIVGVRDVDVSITSIGRNSIAESGIFNGLPSK